MTNRPAYNVLPVIDSEVHYEIGMRNVCARYGKDFTWDTKRQIMGTTANTTAKLIVDLLQLPITPQEFASQVSEALSCCCSDWGSEMGYTGITGRRRVPKALSLCAADAWCSEAAGPSLSSQGSDGHRIQFKGQVVRGEDP